MGRRRRVEKGWDLGGGVEVSSASWCTASRRQYSKELSSEEATQNERLHFQQDSDPGGGRSEVDGCFTAQKLFKTIFQSSTLFIPPIALCCSVWSWNSISGAVQNKAELAFHSSCFFFSPITLHSSGA